MILKEYLGRVAAATMLASLTSCASFSGMPKAVIPVSTATTMSADAGVGKAISDNAALADDDLKRAHRNRIISAYLFAADARYFEFRAAISKDQKGGNFGLDAAILGASGLGAVVKGAANEFSAAAAALTGTRSSLNREVYFERTLPAIIKTMEANRIKVRAEIVQHLRADDIATYPLEQAFADVTLYQLSTTIDGAIQEVTEAAGKAADAELIRVENAIESCGPTDQIGAYWRRINVYASGLQSGITNGIPASGSDDEKKLQTLAGLFKLVGAGDAKTASTATEATTQYEVIIQKLNDFCTQAKLTKLIDDTQKIQGIALP